MVEQVLLKPILTRISRNGLGKLVFFGSIAVAVHFGATVDWTTAEVVFAGLAAAVILYWG
jgi:hypothetical protein